MKRSNLAAFGLAVLSLACVRGHAEQARVTVKLRGVTAAEAVKALVEKTGAPVRLYSADLPPNRPVDGAELRRADFDWSGLTFAQALRQVCERYQLRPSRGVGGYLLYPNPQAPPAAPPQRVGLVEKEGVRLFVRSVNIFENRQVHFLNGPAEAAGSGNLQIYTVAQLGDLDGESIAGIQNVVAKDDLGNALGQQGATYSGGNFDGAYPDEWNGIINLPAPHPRARKLASLEGDVMVYRQVRPFSVEIPLPLTGRSARKEMGNLAFWVGETRPPAEAPDEEPEPLLNRKTGGKEPFTLRVRVYSPVQGAPQARWGWGLVPYLVGASGRIYQGTQLPGSNSGSDGVTMVQQWVLSFPALEEAPARLVWDLLDRADPVKLFSFRMTEIPLPAPVEFNAKAAAPPPAPENPNQQPFYEKGGGTLVSPVQVPGKAPVGARLDLGLAARQGQGWGPVRWAQVELAEGLARLENVKPGTYRLVRRYRGGSLGEGSWAGGEQQVTVSAGKELRLAPLRWVPGKATR